jgi:hypothetical protein
MAKPERESRVDWRAYADWCEATEGQDRLQVPHKTEEPVEVETPASNRPFP